MLSGAAAAVLTQPFDTVKTRMQANLRESQETYSSFTRTLQMLWRTGGGRTLLAGLLPRGGRIMAATVILTKGKEWAQASLERA